MFYTIYKITNTVNGKFYIGKHQTENLNDGYMGSGKLVKRAIKKYGLDKFKKEILVLCESEQEMDQKEMELVEVGPHTYNLCEGGKGGFGYINKSGFTNKGKSYIGFNKGMKPHSNTIEAVKTGHKNGKYKYDNMRGKHHTDMAKVKIGAANSKMVGSRNSQYNTCWITDGLNARKISIDDIDIWLPKGFRLGRK